MFFLPPKWGQSALLVLKVSFPTFKVILAIWKGFFSFILFSQSVANVDYNAVQSISILTPTCCENKTLSPYLHF